AGDAAAARAVVRGGSLASVLRGGSSCPGLARRLVCRLYRRVCAHGRRPTPCSPPVRDGAATRRPRRSCLCLAEVASSDLKPVYLLAGSDRPKIERALARLRSRFQTDASERLSAASETGDDAVAACNALGLFGGGDRLVEVSEVEQWKAADVKPIAGYLKS